MFHYVTKKGHAMKRTVFCGIYCIENMITHTKYIGQSRDIRRRWTGHKIQLRKGQHKNLHLQRSWNKYGEENFSFDILEICPIDKLNEREVWNIKYFDTMNNGFNNESGGNAKKVISQESIEKSRQAHLARHDKQTRERIEHRCQFLYKPIICLTTGEIFNSVKEATQKYHIKACISTSCLGKQTYCGKLEDGTPLRWAYYEDYVNGNLPNHRTDYYQHTKRVCVFDKYFNLLDVCESSVNVAKKFDTSETSVRSCNLSTIPYIKCKDYMITICEEDLQKENISLDDKEKLRQYKQKQYSNKTTRKNCKYEGHYVNVHEIYNYIAHH